MVKGGLASVLRGASPVSMINSLTAYIDQHPTRFESAAGQLALHNTLGKVRSLLDRDSAAAHFQQVRDLDSIGLMEHFYLETGCKTYFSAAEFSHTSTTPVADIAASIVDVDGASPSNKFGVLVALDPAFYRIYSPTLRFYAQQMPDIDFVLLVCGTEAEVSAVVADGDEYSRSLNRLNRSGIPSNLSHFRIPVPAGVPEDRTFFACARFFAVQLMLDRYESTYIMDADLVTDIDPRPYWRRTSEHAFALPAMRGFAALHPWRRYMAGNIAVNRKALSSKILSDLQAYLTYGLSMPHSWALDQNALTFAAENHPGLCTDLSPLKRPFYQPKFRLSWERRHLEHSGGVQQS